MQLYVLLHSYYIEIGSEAKKTLMVKTVFKISTNLTFIAIGERPAPAS